MLFAAHAVVTLTLPDELVADSPKPQNASTVIAPERVSIRALPRKPDGRTLPLALRTFTATLSGTVSRYEDEHDPTTTCGQREDRRSTPPESDRCSCAERPNAKRSIRSTWTADGEPPEICASPDES